MKKNQTQKQVNWKDRLSLNAKGGAWLGLFSFIIAAGCFDVLFLHRGGDIPEGVRWVYATILVTFGGTKLASKFINSKNGEKVEED